MPTTRFYKLPEEKRQVIGTAIRRSYQKRNFANLSLTEVAREAGVSRASLYTYFRDKEDLLKYAFEKEWERVQLQAMPEEMVPCFPDWEEEELVILQKACQILVMSFLRNYFGGTGAEQILEASLKKRMQEMEEGRRNGSRKVREQKGEEKKDETE